MLRELTLDRFPEDAEVVYSMRLAEELAGQQLDDAAAFVAATEPIVQVEEEKRIGEALLVVNRRARSIAGSRQAEEKAWALATAVAAHQEKEVAEVAEATARQTVALLQLQSIDIAPMSLLPVLFWGRTMPLSISLRQSKMRPWPRPMWLAWWCRRSIPTRRTV
jgi:hypothetical protein